MASDERAAVLILGAGINGCTLARELVLGGVDVWLVDRNDIAFGATSRSSRLIHGGLRYLEHGDFRLVRESLEERSLLRQLAPQFVQPLELYIPVAKRTGGFVRAALRFLGIGRIGWVNRLTARVGGRRGLWLVRLGLWLYDRFAADDTFQRHRVEPVGAAGLPRVGRDEYRWLCAYADAQMRFPERFVLALCEDARQLAEQSGVDFRVLPYHRVTWNGSVAEVRPEECRTTPRAVPVPAAAKSVGNTQNDVDRRLRATPPVRRVADDRLTVQLSPSVIINATGAWGDFTLDEIDVPAPRLFGGTKGSHFVSHQPRLRQALGDAGVYAEADDGRLIFVLPFGDGVLVGTTDERFDERPEKAIASPSELQYLLAMVNELFPGLDLTADDVEMHYSGVRPLPYVPQGSTASISRGHSVTVHEKNGVPVLTLIGGKLTTSRAFAAEVADMIFTRLGIGRTRSSHDRVIPGGADYPRDDEAICKNCERIAGRFGLQPVQVRSVWSLCGNRVETIFDELGDMSTENLFGTTLPVSYVRWVVDHEWVTQLSDLVERRLMLLYEPRLHERTLRELAAYLVASHRLAPQNVDTAVASVIERLERYYGKRVLPEQSAADQSATIG